ncbi:hypothetical protein FB567DRAFT_562794 [Paraphoma chrysanthemicola]|uniref:Glycosyltransferase family 25 protein n=1 Tax=Paraphoma chrysanthemicola TaxID=798071 RepID=A0A8K0VV14_9PLEO|nr:hypothetical protein FB567DRAFT_562794 [Paraphoma chrysanthemicola]
MLQKRAKVLSICVILVTLCLSCTLIFTSRLPTPITETTLAPTNSTLGFGTILAVSRPSSPRRASLLWAANLTAIDIVIPEQPAWTEEDVQRFRATEHSTISRGSAFAWLGHLHVLKWFLNTSHSTALIIEDDTDFSLHIRQTQIPRLTRALNQLLTNYTTNSTNDYWPPPSTWSLIYPGHCDDLPSPSTYFSQPHTLYHDPSVPAHHVLHPDTQNFLASLDMNFAHAHFAERIVRELGREKEGGTSAFDVALLEACRSGLDRPGRHRDGEEWKCWSVAPEVFHRAIGGSEIQRADSERSDDGGGDGDEEVHRTEVPERGTWNLHCVARDPGLWVEEDGPREQIKNMVRDMVERGECPLSSTEGEKNWRGCEWGECGAQS